MTNENKIALLYQILQEQESYNKEFCEKIIADDTYHYKPGESPLIAVCELIREIKHEIRQTTAKSSGRNTELKAAERILKTSPDSRQMLKFAHEKDGKQYICNGYILIINNNPLPLPPVPENIICDIDFERLYKSNIYDSKIPLKLPIVADLKAQYKIEKAQHKGEKGFRPVYRFGDELPAVDMQYLIDMLEAMPECKAFSSGQTRALQFENENASGILMPVWR